MPGSGRTSCGAIGIAPLITYQRFKAEGPQAFANPGFSTSPESVTTSGRFAPANNHSGNPIRPQDVTFSILAPGVVQNQYMAGATWRINRESKVTGAFMYAANNSVT